MPSVPGWQIDARFQPAREVAGDFYDVFPIMNGKRIAFLVADVCDKGVGAALFMSLSRSLIRAFAMQHYNINWADDLFSMAGGAGNGKRLAIGANAVKTAIVNTNNYITEHHLDLNMFATCFMGMFDPQTGTIFYINAGHCPPAIVDAQGSIKARLESTGPAVGMFPGAEFTICETKLEHGDMMFIFSDGVTDARNPAGKLFKEEGMLSLLTPPADTAQTLCERILNALNHYISTAVQFDDITMMALKRE